ARIKLSIKRLFALLINSNLTQISLIQVVLLRPPALAFCLLFNFQGPLVSYALSCLRAVPILSSRFSFVKGFFSPALCSSYLEATSFILSPFLSTVNPFLEKFPQ
ncbi:MAG: hypothetical protein MI740_12920, partial [Halanaerobiales bacterium]|nr:hypothetical protein [Halanaerobiales bacterium]